MVCHKMRRRDFIAALLLASMVRQTWAEQTANAYRIAIVDPSSMVSEMSETGSSPYRVLLGELRRLGYTEEQNLIVERHSGEGQTERYVELAREVVRGSPDLIFAETSRIVLYLKEFTSTILIVGITADPVARGIVSSLARPGRNITGVSKPHPPRRKPERTPILSIG